MEDFKLSYNLKNAYRVNSFIYRLKHFPIIKKFLSSTLYGSDRLKLFACIISALKQFMSVFIWKLVYVAVMIMIPVMWFDTNRSNTFITIFTFLTLIGGLLNAQMFDPSEDKYYAMILMRFDAKKYTVSNYLFFIMSSFAGLIPFSIIFGLICDVPLLVCLIMPVYVVCIKNIFNAFFLYRYKLTGKIPNENNFVVLKVVFIAAMLLLAYGLPAVKIYVTPILFYIVVIISVVMGIAATRYLLGFDDYNRIYKRLLVLTRITSDVKSVKNDAYKKSITTDRTATSNKTGYAYFNDIFVQRHRKLLTRSSKRISVVALVGFAAAIICSIYFRDFSKEINDFLKNALPYYLFVMYFVNRGQTITQTMFMNCDHCMLLYRFYRQPGSIVELFKVRLLTLIRLNIVPGSIIALGTTILLYTSGGVSTVEYIVTFVTIIFMSVFFSIHYLVLYYLLQPYNVNLEEKNYTFTIACSMTYVVCYFAINFRVPILVFGTIMIIFTVIYSIAALCLAYKLAWKTFKLRD